MKSFLKLNNKNLHYSDNGSGACIVFLHGYLESLAIWGDFTSRLSKSFRVICMDIPGHGKSEELGKQHSVEQLAETILFLLKKLGIQKCFLVGHSMGGYVALMFHYLYPEMLTGLSLFHSHPFADNEETIKKRYREIELVRDGKKAVIASINIPNAFATDNLKKFEGEVENAKDIALQTCSEGIIANLHAMINRSDMIESLANSEIPFLYVLGKKDNYLNYRMLISKLKLPKNSQLVILEKSGHMGFIEEKEEVHKELCIFIKKYLI